MRAGGPFGRAVVTKHCSLFAVHVLVEEVHCVDDGFALGGVGTVVEFVMAELTGKVPNGPFHPFIVQLAEDRPQAGGADVVAAAGVRIKSVRFGKTRKA